MTKYGTYPLVIHRTDTPSNLAISLLAENPPSRNYKRHHKLWNIGSSERYEPTPYVVAARMLTYMLYMYMYGNCTLFCRNVAFLKFVVSRNEYNVYRWTVV